MSVNIFAHDMQKGAVSPPISCRLTRAQFTIYGFDFVHIDTHGLINEVTSWRVHRGRDVLSLSEWQRALRASCRQTTADVTSLTPLPFRCIERYRRRHQPVAAVRCPN
jgi:hypothetical protein